MTATAGGLDVGDAHADIADPDTYVAGVPHATFPRLRREDPVSWWDEDHAGGRGFWAVTRYADLLARQPRRRDVLQSRRASASRRWTPRRPRPGAR